MNTNATLDQRKQRIETVVKIGLLGVAGFLVAPFIYTAITGLVGLVVAAVVGLVIVNLAPSAAAMIANWRLKALKAVAAANPIETLENQYSERQAALLKMRENIKEFYTVVQEIYAQIQEHDQKFPNKPSQFTDKYTKMKALLELRSKKYKQAQANLAAFADVIDEKRSDWKIFQSTTKACKLANVGEDFQSKLMQDTALTTIQDGLNYAFSELEVSMLDEDTSKATTDTAAATPTTLPTLKAAPVSAPTSLDLTFDEEAPSNKTTRQKIATS